jgi:four helix bundle protein
VSVKYKFQNLLAYRKSVDLAMEIFEMTRTFPKEEKYSLTDQIRRSSRSVPANIAESYAKRLYPKHFISKLTDSDGENLETQSWLEFSLKCKYIDEEMYNRLLIQSQEVGKLIFYMINNPEKFGSK